MTFGKEADENASRALLDQYVEAGGNLIDTADVYAVDLTLTDEQWQRLDEVSAPPLPDYPYGFMDTMGGR